MPYGESPFLVGNWLLKSMKGYSSKLRTKLKIAGATATAIFSLASVVTFTYAWFASNNSVTATGASITVLAPDSLDYEMYYLSSFTDEESASRPGNQNPTTNYFSGYHLDFEDATFTKVTFENGYIADDPDPTNISHLWPAHKLTYAFIITQSTMTSLSINAWDESTGAAEVSQNNPVCLSWAINVYGAAYSVTKTNNDANDVATAYQSYYADVHAGELNDAFNYSQASPAPSPKPEVYITSDIPENVGNTRTIVFFTIEFSNETSTFYKLNKTTGFYELYVSGETTGFNSNCYEGLSLTGMTIKIN